MQKPSSSKYSIYTDEELMQFICEGEEEAFDELYNKYRKPLFAYFYRMLNFDKALAEDALQDVFLKIAETPEKFDRGRSFKTWLFSVASNSCKNFYRHKIVVNDSKEELSYLSDSTNDAGIAKLFKNIDAKFFKSALDKILEELPHDKKEAFILKYQEEKSIADIALIQNCPEGSVKSRLHYTIKLLESKLQIFNPTL